MFVEAEVFYETFANGLLGMQMEVLGSNCRKAFAYDLKGTGLSKEEELEAATALGDHFAGVTEGLLKASKGNEPVLLFGAVQGSVVYYTCMIFTEALIHNPTFVAYLDKLGASYYTRPSQGKWFGLEISIKVTPELREEAIREDRENQKKKKAAQSFLSNENP